MANKPLQSIKFPGLSDTYTTPQVDATLTTTGAAADAKKVGDEISSIKQDLSEIDSALDLLCIEEIEKTAISSPSVVETGKVINSSGDIVDSIYSYLQIWAIPIDGIYDGVGFRVIKGVGVTWMAFYNATTYAECGSSTLVEKVNYVNDEENEYLYPDGATMCLINFRDFKSGYQYVSTKVPKTTSIVEVNDIASMGDYNQIYRYGDKLYYWSGEAWVTVGNDDEELNEILNILVEDKKTKEYIASPTNVDEYKNIDDSGNIIDDTAHHTYIWAVPITDHYTGIGFNVIKGYGKYLAFYTADTYAECDSGTLISLVNYENGVDVEYPIPEGTNIILITYRGDYRSGYLYTTEKVSKTDAEIETLRKDINVEIGETMNLTDLALFERGYVATSGEVVTTTHKYSCVNVVAIHFDRTITYNFDQTLYSVEVDYYDENDTYLSNNYKLTTEQARTILKDSYVRFVISKTGSTTTLNDNELITLPKAIAFSTAFEDWEKYVNDNCGYRSICAKMFEKGMSDKTFANAIGILAAGQSNINGRVPVEDLPQDIVLPLANIKTSIGSKTGVFSDSMTVGSKWGIDLSLYNELNKFGQNFYVIKWSEGGTSLSPYGTGKNPGKWTPFYEELNDISESLLWSFETQIRACLENNPNTFNPRVLIWHQGEADYSRGSKKAALDYYKNFKCLIAYIRGIVKNERLPIIYGTISHNSGQYCPVVEEAQLKIASEDPYVACIDMSGATLLDAYHFDADSAVYFGHKAYDALIDFGIITGTKIEPTPPWENA